MAGGIFAILLKPRWCVQAFYGLLINFTWSHIASHESTPLCLILNGVFRSKVFPSASFGSLSALVLAFLDDAGVSYRSRKLHTCFTHASHSVIQIVRKARRLCVRVTDWCTIREPSFYESPLSTILILCDDSHSQNQENLRQKVWSLTTLVWIFFSFVWSFFLTDLVPLDFLYSGCFSAMNSHAPSLKGWTSDIDAACIAVCGPVCSENLCLQKKCK